MLYIFQSATLQRPNNIVIIFYQYAIHKIEKYTKNMGESNFLENDLVKDGVIRNLEIIGEASKNLPEFIKIEKSDEFIDAILEAELAYI